MEKDIYKAFKALGEPTRFKIVKMLSLQSMCVCELSELLDMLQPRISQHLKVLKEVDLVIENKEGYWVYYSLNKNKLHMIWHEFMAFLDADLSALPGYEEVAKRYENLECNEKVKMTKECLKKKKEIKNQKV